MPKSSLKRVNNYQSLVMWDLFKRVLRRVGSILNPRNIFVRVALSPQAIRRRIRGAGAPVLGLTTLPQGTLERASKIVVLRLDRIGDAILFTNFLRELRLSAPKAEIHLVCSPFGFTVYKNCPYVDRVLVFKQGQPVYHALALHTAKEHWRLYQAAKDFSREHLVPLQADLLLSPRFDVDNNGATFLAAFSRAKVSVSYSEKTSDIRRLVNRGHDRLWSVTLGNAGIEHEVLRNGAFLKGIGGIQTEKPILEFWPTAEERNGVTAFLAEHGLQAPTIVLSPGASEARKQWPAERFEAVARALEDAGHDVVLIGSARDAEVCSSIATELQSHRVKNLCGQLELGALFCLLQRCNGFVGNDSGPAHLAAVAGIPVVVVSCHPRSGKSDYHQSPLRFGPWCVQNRVFQPERAIPPCVDHCSALATHCIGQISADEVSAAILDLLKDNSIAQRESKPQKKSGLCAGVREEFP